MPTRWWSSDWGRRRSIQRLQRALGPAHGRQAQDPGDPLAIPCDIFISATDKYVKAAQSAGHVLASVRGYDLLLAGCSIACESLDRLRTLLASGYRKRDEKA